MVSKETKRRQAEERKYLLNRKEELVAISQSIKDRSVYVLEVLPHIMAVIAKSGVHPVHYQEEMKRVQEKFREFAKKL